MELVGSLAWVWAWRVHPYRSGHVGMFAMLWMLWATRVRQSGEGQKKKRRHADSPGKNNAAAAPARRLCVTHRIRIHAGAVL